MHTYCGTWNNPTPISPADAPQPVDLSAASIRFKQSPPLFRPFLFRPCPLFPAQILWKSVLEIIHGQLVQNAYGNRVQNLWKTTGNPED
jgi:hypothetical protein